jgi:predicted peptidase
MLEKGDVMTLIPQVFEKTITKRVHVPYYLYLPPGFEEDQAKKWPLVFFLHGAGERGTDLSLVGRWGLVQQIVEGKEYPFILVAPQCPDDWTWDHSFDELDHLLEQIIEEYPVEKEQIYLTGLSMGGFGTWHWAVHQPRAFAALVPICGATMPLMGFPQKVAILKDVPIWVFHGDDDQLIPVKESEKLVEVLQSVSAPVRFTRYPGVGHNSWTKAYSEPELIPWMLAQRNSNFSLKKVNVHE